MAARTRKLWVIPVLLLLLVGVLQGASLFGQDLRFTRVQTEVSFWGRESYQPTEGTIRQTMHSLDGLLRNSPNHPDYLQVQANAYAWQSYWAKDDATTAQFAARALSSQRAALHSRPAHLQSRAKMVEYAARIHTVEH